MTSSITVEASSVPEAQDRDLSAVAAQWDYASLVRLTDPSRISLGPIEAVEFHPWCPAPMPLTQPDIGAKDPE